MSFVKLLYFATMVIVATLPEPTQQGAKAADRPQAGATVTSSGLVAREKVRRIETVRYIVR